MTFYKVTQKPNFSEETHTSYVLAESIDEAYDIWLFNNPFWNNPFIENKIEESTYDEFNKLGFFTVHTKHGDLTNIDKQNKAIEKATYKK